jgi:hypothetical protein
MKFIHVVIPSSGRHGVAYGQAYYDRSRRAIILSVKCAFLIRLIKTTQKRELRRVLKHEGADEIGEIGIRSGTGVM